jgi:hypothetical protein
MLRFWTRPLRPAFSSFSSFSRRAMSQSTVEFVSFSSCYPLPGTCPAQPPLTSISLEYPTNKHIMEFRIKSSMPHSPRWTQRFKTLLTRRHGGSTLVSSSLPRRCVGFAMGDLCSLTTMGYIEFNFSRNDGREWLHPDQQVLRGSAQCALLRRQRVD